MTTRQWPEHEPVNEHARNCLAVLSAAQPTGDGRWVLDNETYEAAIARLWRIVRQAESFAQEAQ